MSFNVHSLIDREGSLWQALWSWPKVELHRHLEGSIRLSTLLDVAREYDIPLPANDMNRLRPYVQITDDDESNFAVFLGKFNVLRQFYRSMEIVRRLTREAVEDAARDNVRYMELRFTPHALARLEGLPYDEVIGGVAEEVERAQRDFNILVRLIVSVNRHESVEIAETVVDTAITLCDQGIVGVDLAGLEVGHSARPFRTLFHRAQAAGLHLTVHAGEWDGPENVRDAVIHLGARRIGHGVRSIEDSEVVQLLREQQVALEVCPTSNIHSGVIHRLEHHPLPDLFYLHVLTTINTDDPSLSNITLTDELALAHAGMGMSLDVIKQNILNAAHVAFLPDDERAALVAGLTADLENAPEP